MLQAFIDGSGSGDKDLLVLAGYIATTETWIDFSTEWQSRLNHAGLPVFKMSEMSGRPEIAAWFYRVIEEHDVRAAVSLTLDVAGINKVMRELASASEIEAQSLDNPYYVGIHALMGGVTLLQDEFGIAGRVDFIFDDQSESTRILPAWKRIKVGIRPEVQSRARVGNIFFLDDEEHKPLQAADLYAWWLRKWRRERPGSSVEYSKLFPWSVKKQIGTLHCQSVVHTFHGVS